MGAEHRSKICLAALTRKVPRDAEIAFRTEDLGHRTADTPVRSYVLDAKSLSSGGCGKPIVKRGKNRGALAGELDGAVAGAIVVAESRAPRPREDRERCEIERDREMGGAGVGAKVVRARGENARERCDIGGANDVTHGPIGVVVTLRGASDEERWQRGPCSVYEHSFLPHADFIR